MKNILKTLAIGLVIVGVMPFLTVHAQLAPYSGTPSDFMEFDGLTVGMILPGTGGTEFTATGNSLVCREYPNVDALTSFETSCPITPSSSYSYTISFLPSAQILLDNYDRGTSADIVSGDTVNVFGSYLGNGVITAQSLRDLSELGASTPTNTGDTITNVVNGAPTASAPADEQLLANLELLLQQMQTLTNQITTLNTANSSQTF
jgi:hypothetical protein